MATNKFYLPQIEETEEQYITRMSKVFKKIRKAEKLAAKVANDLADIREAGYKVAVFGRQVRVTI